MSKYVSQYRAAKLAGVTKQSVNQLTRKVPLPLFVHEEDGTFQIDIESPVWALYVQKVKLRKGVMSDELTEVVLVVIAYLREELGFSADELRAAVNNIQSRYENRRKHR